MANTIEDGVGNTAIGWGTIHDEADRIRADGFSLGVPANIATGSMSMESWMRQQRADVETIADEYRQLGFLLRMGVAHDSAAVTERRDYLGKLLAAVDTDRA